MDLKLFVVEDGEFHWIASTDAEAVSVYAAERYEIDPIESVSELPNDEQLQIYFEDEPGANEVPLPAVQDAAGRWYCFATVGEWLSLAKDGDLICSTVY